ncbi:MOSC domain-containing protein [Dehalogenimonas etheniformans]|uniref:MOSC domain-containing protein n=1 Tax=Dehalogenimonas etheniformans TaxID=1536648 RepID=A0A2P5P9X4_9CHLR|nr:MOSC domain-containing protein [Dehalogenimonas etheniformans]PPD59109.1 MOSC domain-containing protein [Dehalogenimonas etheniformans]QNT75846.1 MOSC domain-containing protein [Dehalogenimonas etheniformans]
MNETNNTEGKILSVCFSVKRGTKKKDAASGYLAEDFGLIGDAHAEAHSHRQLSLLDISSVNKMRAQGLDLTYGDFAENITTKGLSLYTLPVGTRLVTSRGVEMEITQIGKECHHHCQIYRQVGMCVMPLEGVFARIMKAGEVHAGDTIKVVVPQSAAA